MTNAADLYAEPHDVSDLKLAFPAALGDLLPPLAVIPEAFRNGTESARPWRVFQERWFFGGFDRADITPREDIDQGRAWRHLSVIQHSYEPKHEHKEAAVAWLASRWFQAVRV